MCVGLIVRRWDGERTGGMAFPWHHHPPVSDAQLNPLTPVPPPPHTSPQAYNAAAAALADGQQLLEIEFPPLSASDMANQASSANTIGAANIRLATDVAKYFTREGKRVVILVPDKDELDLIEEGMGTLEPAEGISIRSVRARSAESAETMTDLLFGIFTRASKCVVVLRGVLWSMGGWMGRWVGPLA